MSEPDPLEVVAWRMVTGGFPSEELPALAVDAIVRGLDSPSLIALAGQHAFDVRESADLFRATLDELDIDRPTPDAAAWSLVRMTLRDIVDGSIGPAAGANEILGDERYVIDGGDLVVFAGLMSELDDHPEAAAEIEAQIVAAAGEVLGRPRPRRWIRLVARAGYSPLLRFAAGSVVEVHAADLPISTGLAREISDWAAEHSAVLGGWPEAGGFDSEQHAESFVRRGESLAVRLRADLGADYQVEYWPEPIRRPGVKLPGRRP